MRRLISCCCLILAGCSSNTDNGPPALPKVPVLAATPIKAKVPVTIETIGTLKAAASVAIRPEASGKLVDILVSEGSLVEKDQTLFCIDSKSYDTKVQEAKSQLAMDQATLDSLNKTLQRYRNLRDKDLIAKAEWDELETNALKTESLIALDKARLEGLEHELNNCRIKAPMSGKIGKIDLTRGQLVTAGQADPLTTLIELKNLIVEFPLTEKELLLLKGKTPPLGIESLVDKSDKALGTLTFLDNQFDADSGLITAKGHIADTLDQFKPGQRVKVALIVSEGEPRFLIPQKAIRYNQQGPYVYIINSGSSAEFRQIKLGMEVGTNVVVLEGIDESDRIITEGHLRLHPGAQVEEKL